MPELLDIAARDIAGRRIAPLRHAKTAARTALAKRLHRATLNMRATSSMQEEVSEPTFLHPPLWRLRKRLDKTEMPIRYFSHELGLDSDDEAMTGKFLLQRNPRDFYATLTMKFSRSLDMFFSSGNRRQSLSDYAVHCRTKKSAADVLGSRQTTMPGGNSAYLADLQNAVKKQVF